MKRWLWLLALPYVVGSSSGSYLFYDGERVITEYAVILSSDVHHRIASCFDKDSCEDMAAALNEAHERRTSRYLIMPATTTWKGCTPGSKCVRQKI